MSASLLEPLQQAFAEHAEALFRKETDDFAAGRTLKNPSCPLGSIARPLLCDCSKTKNFLGFGERVCTTGNQCVVRVVLFPKGTY